LSFPARRPPPPSTETPRAANWIIFDYGEVISTRTKAIPELAAILGVEPAVFEPQYWAKRDAYDRGCTDSAYWSAIGDALGVSVDQSTSDKLTAADIRGWLIPEPASLELLTDLDNAGISLALLSNAPASFARVAEQQDWARHFRATVFSGDLGCAKPDAEIFAALLEKLDAAPQDCLFFDDRQANVDGAVTVGLRAHRWLGVDTATAQLM
jgi:putative hydrolase of the HAD superfamily